MSVLSRSEALSEERLTYISQTARHEAEGKVKADDCRLPCRVFLCSSCACDNSRIMTAIHAPTTENRETTACWQSQLQSQRPATLFGCLVLSQSREGLGQSSVPALCQLGSESPGNLKSVEGTIEDAHNSAPSLLVRCERRSRKSASLSSLLRQTWVCPSCSCESTPA